MGQQGLVCLKEVHPVILNTEVVNAIITVDDEDSYKTTRKLLLKEGLFVGISSGSIMYGVIQKARKLKEGLIVALLPDNGFKYLSTGLFS